MGQSHGEVVALDVIFTVLALSFVGLRVYARRIKDAQFAADDWLVLAAAFMFLFCISVPVMVLAVNSHLGDHQPTSLEGMPLPPTYAYALSERVFQMLHVIPITLVKLGILFFYRRIFRGPIFSAVTWCVIVIVAMWGVSFFCSITFECLPFKLSLTAPPGTPGLNCINQVANFYALSISDVICDLIILVIPFPFVWNLQMSSKHKVAVSSMFLLGGLAIAASVARLVEFIHAGHLLAEGDPDQLYYVAPTAWWVLIECSLALVSASLPLLRPVFSGMSLETFFNAITRTGGTSRRSLGHSNRSTPETGSVYENLHSESQSTSSRNGKPAFSSKATIKLQGYVMSENMGPRVLR